MTKSPRQKLMPFNKNHSSCPYIRKNYNGMLHIFEPVFMKNFFICIGVSNKKFREIAKRQLKLDFSPEKSDGKFYSIIRNKQEVGLIWSSDKTLNFYHECLHAVFWALRERGIELKLESEEAFTYLQEFLIKWGSKK